MGYQCVVVLGLASEIVFYNCRTPAMVVLLRTVR